jgi:hypothetical protein
MKSITAKIKLLVERVRRNFRFMASRSQLHGIELIDCAKANAKQGIEIATELCGYGENINAFQTELKKACHDIGVEIDELSDLITTQQILRKEGGFDIAPESPTEL